MPKHTLTILAFACMLAAVPALGQQPKDDGAVPPPVDPNAPRYLLGHKDMVTATAFMPGGKQALSASLDGTLRTWSIETGRETRSTAIASAQLVSMALSNDGKWVAVGATDGAVKLLDAATGAQIAAYAMNAKGPDLPLAFTPDGKLLAAGCIRGDVKVWNLATGKEVAAFEAPIGNPVLSLAWSPDGSRLVAGLPDTVAPIWDLKAGKEVASLKSEKDWVYPVAYTPDGKTILSGTGKKTVIAWDPATCRGVDLAQGTANIRQIKLSTDGKLMVATSAAGRMMVVDLTTKKTVLEGDGSAASISPDGKWILSADGEDLKIQPLKPAAAPAK